jgi:hypothetical protein
MLNGRSGRAGGLRETVVRSLRNRFRGVSFVDGHQPFECRVSRPMDEFRAGQGLL